MNTWHKVAFLCTFNKTSLAWCQKSIASSLSPFSMYLQKYILWSFKQCYCKYTETGKKKTMTAVMWGEMIMATYDKFSLIPLKFSIIIIIIIIIIMLSLSMLAMIWAVCCKRSGRKYVNQSALKYEFNIGHWVGKLAGYEGLNSFRVWHCVNGWVFLEVSKDPRRILHALLDPWRWRHHVPLKRCEPLTQRHSATSQKTWILSNTTVRTWNLTHFVTTQK